MGAGKGLRLASLPAVLLSTPWGTFTRELVRSAFGPRGRTSAPFACGAARWATDRWARSHVSPPRFTRVGAHHVRQGANRVQAGRECLLNTARPQNEAPGTANTVAGAFVSRSGSVGARRPRSLRAKPQEPSLHAVGEAPGPVFVSFRSSWTRAQPGSRSLPGCPSGAREGPGACPRRRARPCC